jgi:hypothetical protein
MVFLRIVLYAAIAVTVCLLVKDVINFVKILREEK